MSAAEKLPRMSKSQRRKAKALIRSQCANCDGGNCLALDNGEPCPCPQMTSYSLICSYFRSAVLPADQELYAEIREAGLRRCISCGSAFVPSGKRDAYCSVCSKAREKQRKAAWARKNRDERRRLYLEKP